MLRRQKHVLSYSTTPFACTLGCSMCLPVWGMGSCGWKSGRNTRGVIARFGESAGLRRGRHAKPDTLVFLARTPTRKRFPAFHCIRMFKGIFFDTLAFLKRTVTLSTIA